MSDFLGTDYYNLDTLLSEEELAVQKMTREFVESEFMPVVTAHHHYEEFVL